MYIYISLYMCIYIFALFSVLSGTCFGKETSVKLLRISTHVKILLWYNKTDFC